MPRGTPDGESQFVANDRMHAIFKAGAKARRAGTDNPYPGHSILHQLFVYGWVQEDLRLALMNKDPAYREQQERFDAAYPEAA